MRPEWNDTKSEEATTPKNVSAQNLKKCIYFSLNEFKTLIKKLLGTQYTVDCDYEGIDVVVDPELDEIYADPNLEDVLDALSKHFGVRVTSFHTDDCDYVGVWIVYKEEN